MMSTCPVCSENASNNCARCGEVSYCGRECQVKHWNVHRQTCGDKTIGTITQHRRVKRIQEKIIGNIFIAASHWFESGAGDVVVEINESIDDFMKGGTMHFAYISASGTVCDPDIINVIYKFDDYVHKAVVDLKSVDCAALRVKYPHPEDTWSVVFTF